MIETRERRWPPTVRAARPTSFAFDALPTWRLCRSFRAVWRVCCDPRFSFYLITNPPCEVIDLARHRAMRECIHPVERPHFNQRLALTMTPEEVRTVYPPTQAICPLCGIHLEVYAGGAHLDAINGKVECAASIAARGNDAVRAAMTPAKHGARTGKTS